jgi:hypothetical protein
LHHHWCMRGVPGTKPSVGEDGGGSGSASHVTRPCLGTVPLLAVVVWCSNHNRNHNRKRSRILIIIHPQPQPQPSQPSRTLRDMRTPPARALACIVMTDACTCTR